MRLFASDVTDKSWFHDRTFWQRYFDMLAGERFNRFNLALGLGYDSNRHLSDTYFFFAYPFLVDVAGNKVRPEPLDDDERDQNLQSLRFISDEAAARGIRFQLGLWTHAFQYVDSPRANYVIEGLTTDTQAPYCRDALQKVLDSCPNIGGVTFRVHGESGVPEGSYEFWKTVFDGIVRTGREIEIDMHAKGMDQAMIDVALETGLPVNISPKFWAEHMGLPYHQASIRDLEMPTTAGHGQFSLSTGLGAFCPTVMAICLKRTVDTGFSIASGRERSGFCCGEMRSSLPNMVGFSVFAEARGLRYLIRFRSRGVKGPALRVNGMRTPMAPWGRRW